MAELEGDPPQAEPGSERTVRLASILAIDVAGFSSMSERDQRKAARSIEALRARIESVAQKNDGRIFNTAGDGFMLEFASAGSALGAINDLLDGRPKGEPKIRIGAHVGDVVVTVNNDLLGHGVNVAARLQSLAPPNTALVSGEFRSMARNSPSAVFQSRGRQPLEHIDERVATFAIVSQKQQLRRMIKRSVWGASIAAVAATVGVFAGPPVLRYLDEQDLFLKLRTGEAIAAPETLLASVTASKDEVPVTPAPPPPAPEPAAPVEAAPATLKPGDVIQDCASCPELKVLPEGAFLMGSPANEPNRFATEGPQREVRVAAFAMAVHEVTFAEWDACLAGGGCNGFSPPDNGWGRGKRPVIGVSWDDAQAYVRWLNQQAGKPLYRLPSEAEWEYAARGGATTAYAFGARLQRGQAVFGTNRTDPVGAYAANGFGMFDMHGNAWEWVEDCYAPTYEGAPADGSARVMGSCAQRVYRGGGYRDPPSVLRAANRRRASGGLRDSTIGFRVARTLEPIAQ